MADSGLTRAARLRRLLLRLGVALLVPGLVLFVHCGCAVPRLTLQRPPRPALDAIIIPGCPSLPDGALSECQIRRATWGALLWEAGFTQRLITSGAAVYTPYIEAEALAAALSALGVPADRILLEPDALHTDENMYRALAIARRLGLQRLAVASDGPQASGGCSMLRDWDQPCSAIPIEYGRSARRSQAQAELLAQVRARRVADAEFLPLAERERRIAARNQRPRRVPSGLLYPYMALRALLGSPFYPSTLSPSPLQTWAERQALP